MRYKLLKIKIFDDFEIWSSYVIQVMDLHSKVFSEFYGSEKNSKNFNYASLFTVGKGTETNKVNSRRKQSIKCKYISANQ